MNKGYLCLLLHAHLPFIRHPEFDNFLEEDWFYEGLIETYIPLLNVFHRLYTEKIDFRILMTLSPSLCEMFSDTLLQNRFINKLNKLIELSYNEIERTKNSDFYHTSLMYNSKLKECYDIFVNRYDKNLINGFKFFQDKELINIITCGATHGMLPLLNINKNTINSQIEVAVKNYYKHFKKYPQGIWNSECAYYPGLEEIFERWGIKYFFVDTHGILYAEKQPKYGVFAPLYCDNGVAVFGRDVESSKQVWSATEGYPGDIDYRDFYRDIGYDLPLDYIGPYIHPNNIRVMTGFKYYRITGKNVEKAPYNPEWAYNKVKTHAANFKYNREKQIEFLNTMMDREPIIVAPYDAELFGHWWYEGPEFIYQLCKEISQSGNLSMITPMEYLKKYPENQVSNPCMSTWGNKGFFDVWINGSNDWIYKHLHECSIKMVEMSNKLKDTSDNLTIRILNQMARELLIAQTSCWAFIMATGTTVNYAVKKVNDHITRFLDFYNMLINNDPDVYYLEKYEWCDTIFEEIDFHSYTDEHLETRLI